jgi:hypothetical protein
MLRHRMEDDVTRGETEGQQVQMPNQVRDVYIDVDHLRIGRSYYVYIVIPLPGCL